MTLTPVDALVAQLRASPLDFGTEIGKLREDFDRVLAAVPIPDHIQFTATTRRGVPVIESHTPEADSARCLVSLHGGAYTAGSARGYRPLYGALAEQAGVRGIGVDYRLAPEHPFPAAIDDVLAVYRDLLDTGIDPGGIAFGGDSAGGGLTIAALVAIAQAGLPGPGCAVVFSPWVDLECDSESLRNRADLDPSLSAAALQARARLPCRPSPTDAVG
nr:alpha/beta hydrolase fold domain-containing protein [Rhodococcus opacus]